MQWSCKAKQYVHKSIVDHAATKAFVEQLSKHKPSTADVDDSQVQETKEAQRKIEVMEALQRFQDLGLIKPRVYSDEDVAGIVSKLKGQLAVFDDFNDDSDDKEEVFRPKEEDFEILVAAHQK